MVLMSNYKDNFGEKNYSPTISKFVVKHFEIGPRGSRLAKFAVYIQLTRQLYTVYPGSSDPT